MGFILRAASLWEMFDASIIDQSEYITNISVKINI